MTITRRQDGPPGGADPFRLPEVLSVEARHVRYREPRIYFVGREQREAREAVEILVRTSGRLPVVDVPPALFVGETPITAQRPDGRHQYRFYAYEPQRLEEGAAIALGWSDDPASKVATPFRYQPDRPPVA